MKKFKVLLFSMFIFGVTFFVQCPIVKAAGVDFVVGEYVSSDSKHTIAVNSDNSILYDDTYSLTLNDKNDGDTITGNIGTDNKGVTFYQLNKSKIVTGSVVNYTHNGETVYLYDYTVFSLGVEPAGDANGGIEVWSNGSKVNTYSDLQSAVDAAKSGDTIKVTKDLDVTSGAYVSGKNLTIDGGGHTLNSSAWANSVFIVEEGATLNVKNLTVDGGATGFEVDYDSVTFSNTYIPLKSGSDANDPKRSFSVIISKGDLVGDKVNINNNYIGGNGAALYIVSGNANLKDCTFDHNRASTAGAIYIGSNFKNNQTDYPVQNVVFDGVTISNNYSGNAGGVYIYNVKKFTVKNSSISSNTVTGGKGGGFLFGRQRATDSSKYHTIGLELGLDNVQAEIDNCVFDGNWVGNDGYAIENQGAEMLITNSKFTNNVGTSISNGGSVGTISNIGDECDYYDVTIKNCVLEKNRGSVSGIGDHGTKLNLVVENTKFIENIGTKTVFLYSGDLVLRNCEFIREKVRESEVVVSVYSSPSNPSWRKPTIIVDSCTFTDRDYGIADIQLRKYSRKLSYNPATLYLEGNSNVDVHIWDDNRVVVNGTNTGNINKDSFTSSDEGIMIGEDGNVVGEVNKNDDTYTYILIFNDLEDNYTYYKYLYLDKDKTYNQKEIFMKHSIYHDGYMLEYYTDSSYTKPWNYTASVSTNKANLYGKWVEHTHSYDGSTVLHDNAIYEQCECGYLGRRLYLEAPSSLTANGKEKSVVVKNEFDISESDYTIVYQVMNDDGSWEDYDKVPSIEGTYKAILTYNNMSIEKEYTITSHVINPDTSDEIINSLIVFFISICGMVAISVLRKRGFV